MLCNLLKAEEQSIGNEKLFSEIWSPRLSMGHDISVLEIDAKLLITVAAEYLAVDEAKGTL